MSTQLCYILLVSLAISIFIIIVLLLKGAKLNERFKSIEQSVLKKLDCLKEEIFESCNNLSRYNYAQDALLNVNKRLSESEYKYKQKEISIFDLSSEINSFLLYIESLVLNIYTIKYFNAEQKEQALKSNVIFLQKFVTFVTKENGKKCSWRQQDQIAEIIGFIFEYGKSERALSEDKLYEKSVVYVCNVNYFDLFY